MKGLAVLGGLALIALTPIVGGLLAIYNAFWAVKIWALLVVPVLHWPPLPLASAVGFALVLIALRAPASKAEDESLSAAGRFATASFVAVIGPPLAYLVALIVAKILL